MSVRYAPVRGFRARALVLVLPILLISGMLAGTSFPLSEAQGSINVWTDKLTYEIGDVLILSGIVTQVLKDTPVAIQVYNPDGILYTLDAVLPEQDGTFATSFRIGGHLAVGGLWQITARYSGQEAYASFTLMSTAHQEEGWVNVNYQGDTIDTIPASLSSGTIRYAEIDEEFMSLLIQVDTSSVEDGIMEVQLPRQLLDAQIVDAKTGTKYDDSFTVLVDGSYFAYTEKDRTPYLRTLVIEIPAGTDEIEIIGNQLLGLIRTNDAFIWLYGVWSRDPIAVKIVNEAGDQKYENIIKQALSEWSAMLKKGSHNYNAWNFVFSDEPDIIVYAQANPEWCEDAGGYAEVDSNGNQRLKKPIHAYVATSCKGHTSSDLWIKSAAMHEIAHAIGLGHAFNVAGDFMCSIELGRYSCDINVYPSDIPTSLDVEAVMFLYGTDGFAEPNQMSPILNEYRLGMMGIVFDKAVYNPTDTIVISLIFPKADASLREKNVIEGSIASSIEERRFVFFETEENTGRFTATMKISPDQSKPRDLTVSKADMLVVRVKFNDEWFTKQVSVIEQPQKLWKLQTSQPAVIHSGQRTTSLSVSSYVIINVDVSNLQQVDQKFTVLFQVKDSEGIVVDLREFRGQVSYGDITTISNQLWVPTERGMYTIEVFTWNSINNPVPLAPSTSLSVIVK